MPFVAQALRSPQSIQPPFVGRTAERRMFSQQVLTPDEPAVHLIAVWGPPGIGTSALLAKLREDARTGPGHDGCLTALADGRVGSLLQVMRAYAEQLRAAGAPLVAFEDLLDHLMTVAQRACSVEQQAAQSLFARRVQDLAHSRPLRAVPLLGDLYEAESRATRTTVLQQHPAFQIIHEHQPFQEWQAALTRAFFDDLNWLTAKPVQSASARGRRILLFLDEITAASSRELLSWVRTQVLSATISTQVVLVLAGSAPLEQLLPTESYVTGFPLQPLTEDETRAFLAAYGITNPTRVTQLWHKTGGLPLALRLLAPIPLDQIGEEENVITTGVRYLSQQEPGYRYLVRYAALFSRAFFHHDLTVCPMFSPKARIQWSRRLLDLPFVQHDPITGGHIYHPLVQHHVRQRFAREAHASYQDTRQALVRHYQRQLERVIRQQGEHLMREEAGQRLVLALLEQWFWLADETSLRQVVEHVLLLVPQTVDHAALTHLLRTFAQALPEQVVPEQSRHVADLLLAYCEADLSDPPLPERLSTLLARFSQPAGFPASLQARIVGRRAAASLLQDQPRQALADGTRAVPPMWMVTCCKASLPPLLGKGVKHW